MILLQLTAGQGPKECCLAVTYSLWQLEQEAQQHDVLLTVLEQEPMETAQLLASVLVSLEGEQAECLARQWIGTVQWIYPSPYRPHHRRKNWFIGVYRCAPTQQHEDNAIRFETMRASGAGGQHVNKTESAVRATHIATGISVKIQSNRSQHANKKIAIAWLMHKIAEATQSASAQQRAKLREQHFQLERGNPVRVLNGAVFVRQ